MITALQRVNWNVSYRNYLLAIVVGLGLGAATILSPVAGFALVIGIVFLLVALTYPIVLCYLAIIGVTLLSGLTRGRFIPLLIPSEAILVGSAALAFPAVILRKSDRAIPRSVVLATGVLLLGTAILPLISFRLRNYPLATSDVTSLLGPFKYLVLFWLFAQLPTTNKERQGLLTCMFLCTSVIAVVGLLQGFKVSFVVNFLNQWYPSDQTSSADSIGRVTSLLRAWNALGTFLMVNLILIVAIQPVKQGRILKYISWLAATLSAAALLASGSWAGLGGAILGIGIIKFFDRRGLKFMLHVVVGFTLSGLLVLPLIQQRLQYQFGNSGSDGTPQTLSYRIKVWGQIFAPVLQQNPLFGIAPTFANFAWRYAESQYIYLIVRSGLVGIAAHFFWVITLMWWLFSLIRNARDDLGRTLAIVGFTLLTILTIIGLTNEVFTLTGAAEYLWIVLALITKSEVTTK